MHLLALSNFRRKSDHSNLSSASWTILDYTRHVQLVQTVPSRRHSPNRPCKVDSRDVAAHRLFQPLARLVLAQGNKVEQHLLRSTSVIYLAYSRPLCCAIPASPELPSCVLSLCARKLSCPLGEYPLMSCKGPRAPYKALHSRNDGRDVRR